MRKVALIGGGGLRTPLVIYGLAECQQQLGVEHLVLYDIEIDRAAIMAGLGREIVRCKGADLGIDSSGDLEAALERRRCDPVEHSGRRHGGARAR
jgi:6-phospho-beta-glucosidase